MNELTPINYNGQRVLTTAQLADRYDTEAKIISQNFNRNRERYQNGMHYFVINRGEEGYLQFEDSPYANQPIYLWTEKGCLLHAKSLGTDKAWEVYEMLVDTYFRVKELQQPKTREQVIQAGYQALLSLVEEMQPKAQKFDSLMDATNYQDVGTAAKALNIGRNTLFGLLREKHVFTQRNTPYQSYIDRGYFVVKEYPLLKGDASEMYAQTYVTSKGINFLHDWLNDICENLNMH